MLGGILQLSHFYEGRTRSQYVANTCNYKVVALCARLFFTLLNNCLSKLLRTWQVH